MFLTPENDSFLLYFIYVFQMVSKKEVTSAFKNMHIGKEPHSKAR